MSNYHGEIINIPMHEDGRIQYLLEEQPDMTGVIAYKFGHRDARHAAAEIAIEADQRIAELEAQLNKLVNSARAFLSEIENGQGCMCAATASDVTPHCDFCDKSMTLSNALPAEDLADF